MRARDEKNMTLQSLLSREEDHVPCSVYCEEDQIVSEEDPSLLGIMANHERRLRTVVRHRSHDELDMPFFTIHDKKVGCLSWGSFYEIVRGPVVLFFNRKLNLGLLLRL